MLEEPSHVPRARRLSDARSTSNGTKRSILVARPTHARRVTNALLEGYSISPFYRNKFSCADMNSDVLARHEYTHKPAPATPGTRQSRACASCARARERCSKDIPCTRCATKAIECVYAQSARGLPLDSAGRTPRQSAAAMPSHGSPEQWDGHPRDNAETPSREQPARDLDSVSA